MDDNAAKWAQVYKQEHGLGSWSTFIEAVEKKFGDVDYRDALSSIFDLYQTATVEEYVSAFEDLQYQLSMHNRHLGEMFFVTQFIKGLTPKISAAVLLKFLTLCRWPLCWHAFNNSSLIKANSSRPNIRV